MAEMDRPSAEGTPSGAGTVVSPAEFGKDPAGHHKRWKAEIETARRTRVNWTRRAEKVLRRYLDERDTIDTQDRKFNILWSNVQVLRSALYNKPPKPEVSRKFNTTNPVNRVAAVMMERNLEYMVCEYGEFDAVMRSSVLDRLLPGQGTAWVRYSANIPPAARTAAQHPEPSMGTHEYAAHEAAEPPAVESAEHANQGLTDDAYLAPTEETVCYDYVHWKDFLTSPARTWEEVTWVARRVYLTRDAGTTRFGQEFASVPLNYRQKEGPEQGSGNKEFGPGASVVQKAAVWEIWDKTSRKVIWICEDHPKTLDERDDLLQLRDFFPCPKPLLSTTTTDSIVPTPDYCMYQDQGMELDSITNRISMLTQALKVIGVYDKTQEALQRLLTEGVDNVMIPVDNWAMFAERGGIKGTVDFFPLEQVVLTLEKLIAARTVVKQDVYEITGMADIVRGASVASESATAQNLKAKFADVRIADSQKDVARFAADLINMSAEIITNFFQPESIILGADMGDQNDPDAQYVEQAIQLIKTKALIKHRITVSTDAITEQDRTEEKEARVEFLTALGQFFQQAAVITAEKPEMLPLMAQLTLWGVRGFRVGRDVEGMLEQTITQMQQEGVPEKGPTPEEQKAQMEQKKLEQDMNLAQQKAAADVAAQQAEIAAKAQEREQEAKFRADEFAQKLDFQQKEFDQKLAFQEREFALKMQQTEAETTAKAEAAQLDAAVKMQAAEVDAATQAQAADQDASIKAQSAEQDAEIKHEQAEAARREKPDAA